MGETGKKLNVPSERIGVSALRGRSMIVIPEIAKRLSGIHFKQWFLLKRHNLTGMKGIKGMKRTAIGASLNLELGTWNLEPEQSERIGSR
jgi:hypothetical protein